MKKISTLMVCFIALLNCSEGTGYDKEIKEHVLFVKKSNKPAKEYILDLFDIYDLVILCERYHSENTQYKLIMDVVSDSRFIENVGNIFFETAMRSINPELKDLVRSENLSKNELQKKLWAIQRNSDYYPLWEPYNLYHQNKAVYKINQSLSEDEKINIYATDIAIKQDSVTAEQLMDFWNGDADNRDRLMAEFIIDKFEKIKSSGDKRKKALVIMNYRHAYNRNFQESNGNIIYNVGAFLFDKYPKTTANVLINSIIMQNGKWDAAFEVAKKDDLGFDFKNSPFGKDQFDMWSFTKHENNYQDIFTGFAYYKSPKEFELIDGVDGLIDSSFMKTYKNRVKKWQQLGEDSYPLNDDEIYKMYGTKNIRPLDEIDSISTLINRWIKK
ncbi:hypothetical protein [Ulvibacterium sp.]|uniref:hypothetical protein n=1 Tax=Ulvibacterium sp. TaxID=2665914 RepID=UPI003BABD6F9